MIRMFRNVARGFSLVRTTLRGRTTKGGVPRNDKNPKQNEFWYLNLEFRICLEFRN